MQGRGFGYNALVVATAFTLGPTIASGILAIGPWPWLFAVNIPFGVVAILIGLKTLPRTPRATHSYDFSAALLAAGCLGLFILGIGSAAHHARPWLVAVELGSAVLLGWVLIRRQADHPAPVLPIDSTLAGSAYETISVKWAAADRTEAGETYQVWIPLVDGTERLGVLNLTVADVSGAMLDRYRALASLVGIMIMAKSSYSDTYARTQRTQEMALQAELVWAFLAPRTFATWWANLTSPSLIAASI